GPSKFEKAVALPTAINRDKFYCSGTVFSDDGNTMYFTSVKLQNDAVEISDLYISNYNGDESTQPNEVKEVRCSYKIQHPALGELLGQKVLFFTSDMDGGMGKSDIYYSTITGGGFATPVNLGKEINTPYDEITPFYYDGKLFFSSNGHP